MALLCIAVARLLELGKTDAERLAVNPRCLATLGQRDDVSTSSCTFHRSRSTIGHKAWIRGSRFAVEYFESSTSHSYK